MTKNANFKVDPKLAELLGETYRSTEDAIKELVDNAFDADANHIHITLPDILNPNGQIEIIDDGTGMKETEVRSEYLKIASSRFSRKGDRTFLKNRVVKGRKGIGKFSGLMVAEVMEVATRAEGKETVISISKESLSQERYDLEKVKLPVTVSDCDKTIHGTTIRLKGLSQNFDFPNPAKLKQILILDYGRVADLKIYVNNEILGIQDFAGKTIEKSFVLPDSKSAKLIYTISEKPLKQFGLVYRVANKIVGRAQNLLKDDEVIPDKLKKRVVGEIECDDLEPDVTADWGAIVENSKLLEALNNLVLQEIKEALNGVFKTEMHLAKQRYRQKIDRELQKLPQYKRQYAEKYLMRILEKFYGESEEKINTIISVMVDAIEKDYYWNVISQIEAARDGDIERFAEALSEFGILEMSVIAAQATNRLRFLDEMDLLRSSPNTLESTMHKALENNLWVLGTEYSLIFSNKTLAKAIEDYLGKQFSGLRANRRPDLFLGADIHRNHLLIEFKRPSETVGRPAESQALQYRDDLNSVIHGKKIQIMIIGGLVDPNISSHNERDDVSLLSYTDIISNARNQLEWLLRELKASPV